MVIRKGLLRHPRGQPKLSSQRKMKLKLKSSKTTCNFNHAIPLKFVCLSISQSYITHNTPTYYSNVHNRSGMKLNFFLGEVVLWYAIYVLLAQIRTIWVVSTYLFTYAAIGVLRLVNLKGPNFWSKKWKFKISKENMYSSEIRKLVDYKFLWKSVELSKLNEPLLFLDKIQRTLKSSHKDIRTTKLVPRKRKAMHLEAHSIYKSLLETRIFRNRTKKK